MYVKRTYIAEDGKEFSYELECRAYESKLFTEMYGDIIKPFVSLFNQGGQPAELYYINDIHYVYVHQVPDFEDEEFLDIWDKIIPGNLTSTINEYGVGWYFRDEQNEWFSWAKQEEYFNQMKKAFENMTQILPLQ